MLHRVRMTHCDQSGPQTLGPKYTKKSSSEYDESGFVADNFSIVVS